MDTFKCISPIDGSVLVTRPLLSDQALNQTIQAAKRAQKQWIKVSLEQRIKHIYQFMDNILNLDTEIIPELARQMGRPVKFGGEMGPLKERIDYMTTIAPSALADYVPEHGAQSDQITRYIKRVPLGVVLVIAPWNYPYITAINSIVPALLAGNAVILKHSEQTLLVGERFAQAFANTGLPSGLFSNVVVSHAQIADALKSTQINHVTFTGSVEGGRAVERAAAGSFATMNLELGGKDPAYVCADANLEMTASDLADGAFYNAGQCCCGIERIYVERKIFSRFVELLQQEAYKLKLGNPLDPSTSLGPMAHLRFADNVRKQISQALSVGAKALIDDRRFPEAKLGTAYLGPQILIDVDHSMSIMQDESFGPVVGVMPVDSDQQAIELMNDSVYGLTASIWTKDQARAIAIADKIESGIVFMNRCDYVDPSLVWAGVKNTGRGAALSRYGFDTLTKPKSYHLRRGKYC